MKRVVAAGTVAIVVLACLAPALALLLDSLRGPDGFSFAAWTGVLREARQARLLARSVYVAGTATCLALVFGTAVGYAVWRLGGWRSSALETLAYLPLLLPSLVIAMGWVYLCGRAGALTTRLEGLGLSWPFTLYSPTGAAFVLSLCCFPCVSILAAQGFRSLERSGLRAARMHAGAWTCFWRVWRPQLAPYLASGALLAFLLALADFGVPSALMVNVYPIEIFTQFSAAYDVKAAIASSAAPMSVAAALFLARHVLVRATPQGSVPTPGGPDGPPARAVVALALLVLGLALGLPLGVLLLTARGAYAEALRIAGEQVLTSLSVSLLGAGLMLAGGLAFALAYRGLARRGRALAEALALLVLLVPGATVGLGILLLVTHGVWPFAALYPHAAILAYAGAARFLPLSALLLAASVAGLRADLFRCAAVHGAGPVRCALRIALPLLVPALAAAATVSFLACMGELSAAVLVSPPGTMTLPVRLASLLHFGKDSIVAALCVMLVGLVASILFLGFLLAGAPIRLRLLHADRAA